MNDFSENLSAHLSCSQLSYRYSKKSDWALDPFSHEFQKGITILKGFSGCGKSTLLRLLAGYLKPTEGSVQTHRGAPWRNSKYYRKDLGFVFQQLNLLPLTTVKRNLELANSLAGVGSAELKRNTTLWLSKLGLDAYKSRAPSTLSGGQQQRASIARCLIKNPRIALLDEPTSGLDDLNTSIISKTLSEFVQNGSIVLIASHDPRLDPIAHEIIDFNNRLPLERHLESLV
jgi:ABC-type multidrug transport system ATPase subunit